MKKLFLEILKPALAMYSSKIALKQNSIGKNQVFISNVSHLSHMVQNVCFVLNLEKTFSYCVSFLSFSLVLFMTSTAKTISRMGTVIKAATMLNANGMAWIAQITCLRN